VRDEIGAAIGSTDGVTARVVPRDVALRGDRFVRGDEAEHREATDQPVERRAALGDDVARDGRGALDARNATTEVVGDGVAFHDWGTAAEFDAAGSIAGRVRKNGIGPNDWRGTG